MNSVARNSRVVSSVLLIVMVIFGLILSLGIVVIESHQYTYAQVKAATTTLNNPTTNLRKSLNNLFYEHTVLTSFAVESALNDNTNTQSAFAMLNAKNEILASTIDKIYPGNRHDLKFLLSEENWYFVDYINAIKQHDLQGKIQARQHLDFYAEQLTGFFGHLNPFIDLNLLHQQIVINNNWYLNLIDAYDDKNATKTDELLRKINDHVSQMADMLSTSIIRQYPNKY